MNDGPITRRDLVLLAGLALPAHAVLAEVAERGADRPDAAYQVRVRAAALARDERRESAGANGDEEALPGYVAAYSKGLPHDDLGHVQPAAYALLLRAVRSGESRDFELVPRIGESRLTNPQGGLAFNLVGPDPSVIACAPAPSFASAGQSAEMVELYWQALLRDVPFAEYASHPLAERAAEEIGRLRGVPTTPANLFRTAHAGSARGPYLSQFLWKEIAYTPLAVAQKLRTATPGRDHLADRDRWLDLQNGISQVSVPLETVPCFVRTGRDLAEYVHRDFTYQAALSASLILLQTNAPPNLASPYASTRVQSGFTTFGAPYLLYLIATATHAALTACWFQKWNVHRRLRPEEFGGRVANQLEKRASYPLHASVLDSDALARTLRTNSTALLTSSYPEGAPTHPAYPAGHAVVAAAGVTILKAFFDENHVLREPVVCSPDGQSLQKYDGPPLTVRGELDKLAANIGMGRCFAGIHWRSDVEEGLRLGEEAAISVLREMQLTSREPFGGFRFHRLDGTPVTA
jgi:hypothetical protein